MTEPHLQPRQNPHPPARRTSDDNLYGLLYKEITASSGEIACRRATVVLWKPGDRLRDQQKQLRGGGGGGYVDYGAIHKARAMCEMHQFTPYPRRKRRFIGDV